MLLTQAINLKTLKYSPCISGHTEVVRYLIQAGAKLDAHDLHYGTPLHAACSRSVPSLSCIRALLQAGEPQIVHLYIKHLIHYSNFLYCTVIATYPYFCPHDFRSQCKCPEEPQNTTTCSGLAELQ